jgi:hypothetical protein
MKSSDNIVLIAGDSFAAGEWRDPGVAYKPYDVGVGHNFILHGYQVRNVAKPGGSNLESYTRVKHYLQCNQHEIANIKFILFWQTEFYREMWHYSPARLEELLNQGYSAVKNKWIYEPYFSLAEIYQEWKIPIYIIGGASDAVGWPGMEEKLPGVNIVCESITNLLLKNDHRATTPVYSSFISGVVDSPEYNFLDMVKKNISSGDLEILLNDIDIGRQRIELMMKNPHYFYPDGIHPNESAQKRIFEFLLTAIPELNNHNL